MKLRPAALVLLIVVALAGCHAAPIAHTTIEDPDLARIAVGFEDVVRAAHENPDSDWHSGWLGNLWVNYWGDDNLGLCYQWQEWVYQEIVNTVESVGWEACGVAINMETKHEHHAVVVFDPRVTRRDQILTLTALNPAFVLDAWRRGRADVYTMADWLTLPDRVDAPAELEVLPWDEDLGLPFRPRDQHD